MSTQQPTFCAVATPSLVFAGPRHRHDYDRLPLPETVGDWAPSFATSMAKADGREWEVRIRSKAIEGCGAVTVIFQWREERPVAMEAAA